MTPSRSRPRVTTRDLDWLVLAGTLIALLALAALLTA